MQAEQPSPERQGEILLELAREALGEVVLGTVLHEEMSDAPEDPQAERWLREPGATFVTLRKNGELRGCLGTLTARRPLVEDVRSNARAAGARDPRFPPVRPAELPELSVEVSLLSPLVEVHCDSEEQAIRELSLARCGWVLECGSRSGTFLPQVWEMLPQPEDFWRRLKEKAGLSPDFWDPTIRLWRYSVAKWSQEAVGAGSL